MRSFCQGVNTQYMIHSELLLWQKASLALAMNVVDEEVMDRQRPLWRNLLLDMHAAQDAPSDRIPTEDAARKMILGK